MVKENSVEMQGIDTVAVIRRIEKILEEPDYEEELAAKAKTTAPLSSDSQFRMGSESFAKFAHEQSVPQIPISNHSLTQRSEQHSSTGAIGATPLLGLPAGLDQQKCGVYKADLKRKVRRRLFSDCDDTRVINPGVEPSPSVWEFSSFIKKGCRCPLCSPFPQVSDSWKRLPVFEQIEMQEASQQPRKLCNEAAFENGIEQHTELLPLHHPSVLPMSADQKILAEQNQQREELEYEHQMLKEQSVVVKLKFVYTVRKREQPTKEGHTHDFKIFVLGDDGYAIENFISTVAFRLDLSYCKPIRARREPPFEINVSGCAEFTVCIYVYFRTKEEPRKMSHTFNIKLKSCETFQKVVLEKELTFQNPGPDFRKKFLLDGGVVLSDSPCEVTKSTVINQELATSPIQSPESDFHEAHLRYLKTIECWQHQAVVELNQKMSSINIK